MARGTESVFHSQSGKSMFASPKGDRLRPGGEKRGRGSVKTNTVPRPVTGGERGGTTRRQPEKKRRQKEI